MLEKCSSYKSQLNCQIPQGASPDPLLPPPAGSASPRALSPRCSASLLSASPHSALSTQRVLLRPGSSSRDSSVPGALSFELLLSDLQSLGQSWHSTNVCITIELTDMQGTTGSILTSRSDFGIPKEWLGYCSCIPIFGKVVILTWDRFIDSQFSRVVLTCPLSTTFCSLQTAGSFLQKGPVLNNSRYPHPGMV